ncbi:hypothetical protein GCM10027436_65170 [Actinophytocola sediminis]
MEGLTTMQPTEYAHPPAHVARAAPIRPAGAARPGRAARPATGQMCGRNQPPHPGRGVVGLYPLRGCHI